jgi:hypothetical protein
MKILVACEYSGTVRDSFTKKGHDVTSCDLLPTDVPGKHYQGDVTDIINDGWDMMIGHPPCTFLTVTGNKWYYHPDDKALPLTERRPHPNFPNRAADREEGVDFFMLLANANIDKICLENPVGIMSTRWRKPEQIVQPYQFGHSEAKKTCLWLKNLPKLVIDPAKLVEPEYVTYKSGKRMAKWYADAVNLPKQERMKLRSKTFQGVADAFVEAWG